MDEQNQTGRTSTRQEYKTKPYKSSEEIIFVDSGVRDFLVYGGKALYGIIATFFRVPTFVRKGLNRQLWIQREDLTKTAGAAGGLFFGSIAYVSYLMYSLDQAPKGNYAPLAILAATNILSGAYELRRLSKSKQENLELKAQLEKKKQETQTEPQLEEKIAEAEKTEEKSN